MFKPLKRFVNITYKKHLLVSLVIRLVLIIYGICHDQISEVKYTDIDYKVFTDASRHVLNGNSPYDRHTFRYSPLIAICLIPNITIHHSFGKILFSLVDIIVGLLIRIIVKSSLKEYDYYKRGYFRKVSIENDCQLRKLNMKSRKKLRKSDKQQMNLTKAELLTEDDVTLSANIAMISWLYNPLTIAIGTRGNCDSVAGCFVLLTLYFLQCKHYPFVAGLIHGISIHFRLYPIMYSLSLFMYLSEYSFYSTEDRRKPKSTCSVEATSTKQLKNVNTHFRTAPMGNNKIMPLSESVVERKTIFKKQYLLFLVPNSDQLKLISGCISSLSVLTWLFYQLFGYKFLFETYIYHLVRKDTRHNFSMFFYLQYLTAWVKNVGFWQKVLTILPQIVLILVFSIRYGLNRFTLNFSVLTQTIVMVIYNSVLTSQYFVWIMVLLPLCLWQIKMSAKMSFFLLFIWFIAQGVWLLPAYLLEFQGHNTFFFIWIQSVSFFCANIAILGRFIMYFMPQKEKNC